MKKIKRILSAVLAAAMIAASASIVSAAQVAFTDVSNHWAWQRGYISYLVEKDVINGYKQSNGTYMFKPDGTVTRAEFIKMLDETFGLTETRDITGKYKDVSANDWFYEYFAKAVEQGYILNYGTSANPNGALSREEATSLLVRYLNLPDNEKMPADTFADYGKISSYYSEDILKAAYAELINGYEESNGTYTFRPKNTLTRAEALTILYRAAGAIFTTSKSFKETGAFDENAVVKTGDITLQKQSLSGRVIISEGADNGTVGFYESEIKDVLYIRGGANVTIADTTAKKVVVDSADKISLSVLEGAKIGELVINERCSVMLAAGTSVDKLITTDGANLTSVTGSGSIKSAYIASNNFTSAIVPQEFDIANGLTATFSGVSYQGTSDAQESFFSTPFVTVDDGMFCINVLPLVDGTVRYYYTNSSYCPNIANFDGYYNSATYRSHFAVQAKTAETEVTYDVDDIKTYGYVVLQLQSNGRLYPPVIVPNADTSGSGFSTDPYLLDEKTIRYTTGANGTVYYMYSDVGSQMNTNEFIVAFEAQSKELKNTASASSLRPGSVTVNSKYAELNRYMIFLFQASNGLYYTPVTVPLGDDGFSENPSVTTLGTIDFKTSVSGNLYYYYSYDNDLPSPDKFNASYRTAEENGNMKVTKGHDGSLTYKTKLADEYPYIIFCLRDENSQYMLPVAVKIDYDPGFSSMPEVLDESTIRFKTSYDGTVYYYYSKEGRAPSPKDFDTIYYATEIRYKGSTDVSGGSYKKITYDVTKAPSYPYMVIMLEDANGNMYQPVVVSLQTTANTGFATPPYVFDDEIYFKTSYNCEVWWYYARTEDAVSSSDFYSSWVNAIYGYSTSATSGKHDSITYDSGLLKKYPYIVIATSADTDSDTFTYPIIINVSEEAETTTEAGLIITNTGDGKITLNTFAEGYVYYYETDSAEVPSKNGFTTKYLDAPESVSGRKEVGNGEEGIEIEYSGQYGYMMIQLESEDSLGRDVLYEVVCINLKTGGGSSDSGSSSGGNADGSTKYGYGFELKEVDTDQRIVTVVSEQTGTLKATLATADFGFSTTAATQTIIANEEISFTYPAVGGPFELELFLQFTDASGNVYQRYGGISINN